MRLKQLDILRGVAILLVFGRHYDVWKIWHRGGWAGVDLFFVLSGFLISGLLFTEYKRYGQIRIVHFLIRRGFKIYPPFYAMVAWSVVLWLLYRGQVDSGGLFSELFFLQSYRAGLWPHTWSLAVEEHFYLALPFVLLLLCRISRDRTDPFRAIPWLFAAVASSVLVLRLLLSWESPAAVGLRLFRTHLNIDGLLFGVLISYLYHFRRDRFERLASLPRWLLLPASGLLVLPCFLFDSRESFFIQTFGHSLLYVGYGGLLIAALVARADGPKSLFRVVGASMAIIGSQSYSIYLWHYPFATFGMSFLRHRGVLPEDGIVPLAAYVIGSIALGIAMARLVEIPALKIRDRLFPSRSNAFVVSPERGIPALSPPEQVTEAA